MYFSNAVALELAPCARTAPRERSGKWKHSIGNQPRSGANGLSTERVVAASQLDLGMPAVHDLADRLVQGRRVVDRRERREPHGHALGEVALPRARAEDAQERPHRAVPRRHRREHLGQDAPRGHQNSSASELITQSAP